MGREFLKVFVICALLGAGAFFWFASRLTSVESIDSNSATMRFQSVTRQFQDPTPFLRLDASGQIVRNRTGERPMFPVVPTDVVVMAWRGSTVGLVQVRIPIWFLRMKGPALSYMLRDTDFDIASLNLDVDEIQAWGAGPILDHHGRQGHRVLIWSE